MKYKRAFAALLAVLMCTVTAGCSEGSHIITQHTSRTDNAGSSKPYATDDSLTRDDITLTVWESKDGPDEWIKKAGESFNSLSGEQSEYFTDRCHWSGQDNLWRTDIQICKRKGLYR